MSSFLKQTFLKNRNIYQINQQRDIHLSAILGYRRHGHQKWPRFWRNPDAYHGPPKKFVDAQSFGRVYGEYGEYLGTMNRYELYAKSAKLRMIYKPWNRFASVVPGFPFISEVRLSSKPLSFQNHSWHMTRPKLKSQLKEIDRELMWDKFFKS